MSDRSVLVLEDNAVLAESIAFALTTFGWTVVGPFGSNAEALPVATEDRFATAVLDLDLGSETSIPVASVLLERDVPFVFLTGHDASREIPDDFADVTCLSKPVTPEALVKVLEATAAAD
ncbi:MAG: response regulator [Planctomycetota bacterium]